MLHDELPVYKASYDLFVQIFGLIGKFPKQYKYTIGEKIKNEIIELLTCIYKANSSFETRKFNINSAIDNLHTIRLMIRLSRDLKIVNLKNFVDINMKLESISKQLYSWKK